MAERRCLECGSRFYAKNGNHRYCRAHSRAKSRPAGAPSYDWRHQKRRAAWVPRVATGTVRCGRGAECAFAEDGEGGFIHPGEPWDLGHVDGDPSRYSGPEHVRCNRATFGRNGSAAPSGGGKLGYLEAKVPFGIVRCGLCGFLIRKGMDWRVGGNGPEHVECERLGEQEPPDAKGVRLWSQDWI